MSDKKKSIKNSIKLDEYNKKILVVTVNAGNLVTDCKEKNKMNLKLNNTKLSKNCQTEYSINTGQKKSLRHHKSCISPFEWKQRKTGQIEQLMETFSIILFLQGEMSSKCNFFIFFAEVCKLETDIN